VLFQKCSSCLIRQSIIDKSLPFLNILLRNPGACDYSVELPHWSYCSWFDVCWSSVVFGLEWYPCCRKINLMSLAILFHFFCAQHISDINISIIRSLRLFCSITTLVVLLFIRFVLEFRCGWVGVVFVLQAEAGKRVPLQPNHTETPTHNAPRTIRPI